MTLPEARNLLDKYWEGDTTLEEEDRIKNFFCTHSGDSLPPDLKRTAGLFSFYEKESGRTTEDIYLPEMHDEKQEQPQRSVRSWWKYAAAFILLLAGTSLYFSVNQQSPINGKTSEFTHQERMQAFKTTKNALKLIAGNLNKGKAEMQELAVFARVQHEIAGN